MRRFARFACIDWSGAAGRWHPGIAVACCAVGDDAPALVAPPDRHWTRGHALAWLRDHAREDLLIGIDFSPSLPLAVTEALLGPDAPVAAPALWALVEAVCRDDDHLAATAMVRHPVFAAYSRVGRVTGARFYDCRDDSNGLRRAVEREAASGNAASCLNLVGAKQVGRSSLTGMRVLHRLAGAIPVWPFDPAPRRGALIVEIYTGIAARAAMGGGNRTKMDRARLADALAAPAIASADVALPPGAALSDHQTDALLTAAWLRRAADDPALWTRPSDPVARAEGWTFGVPYRGSETRKRVSAMPRRRRRTCVRDAASYVDRP